MKSLESIKLERIKALSKELEKVNSYLNRFPGDTFFLRKLNGLINVFDNYPEYIRQMIAHEAYEYVDMRTKFQINNYSNLLNITKEDEESKLVDNVTFWDTEKVDNAIQKIYESYGYTDTLPLKEMRLLEDELENDKSYLDMDKFSQDIKRLKVLKNYVGEYAYDYSFFKTTEQIENELGLQRVMKK